MPAKPAASYVAIIGYVIALSAATGDESWRVELPHGALLWEHGLPQTGYGAVLLAVEGAVGGVDISSVAAVVARRRADAAAASAGAAGAGA